VQCARRSPFWGKTSDCPSGEITPTPASLQSFEGGSMLWSKDKRQILVLYSSGKWQRFEDTWKVGDAEAATEIPPADRVAPQRGFGKVWANNSAVRQQL